MRQAIALLITLFFIILITIALGVSLKQTNKAKKELLEERFLIQSNVILEDVLQMLRDSKELNAIVNDDTGTLLYSFLSSSSFIPIQSNGYKIGISIASGSSKFNINNLQESNTTNTTNKKELFRSFLVNHQIEGDFLEVLCDTMDGFKEDATYNSDIFLHNPELFRNYLTSSNHLETLLLYYKKTYHENPYKDIEWGELLTFLPTNKAKINLNYATPAVWELLTGCSPSRAKLLSQNGGAYSTLDDIGLDENEKERLSAFRTTFFDTSLSIAVTITYEELESSFSFLYDLKTKRGTNFAYNI